MTHPLPPTYAVVIRGGWLKPGEYRANTSGKPELVLSHEQWRALMSDEPIKPAP